MFNTSFPQVINLNNVKDNINNALKNLSEMNDATIVWATTVISIIIIIVVIIYEQHYYHLKNNENKLMESVYGELNGKISNSVSDTANASVVSKNKEQYTFKDYYIKTAYNCCSGGNYKHDYVDTRVLKTLLKQGVRCLDFEIFSIDDQPVVATSTSENNYVKETFNYIPFVNIMQIIRACAFSSANSPNFKDPLIIHLRIKSTHQPMYEKFADILQSYTDILLDKNYSYNSNNKPTLIDSTLAELSNKVIIMVDQLNNSFIESKKFYEFVNMVSNSAHMRALHYYDIKYTQDLHELIEFNKLSMTIGMPDKGENPVNPSSIILREAGCQFLAMRYQLIDVNIEENDIFFNENGSAFVLKPLELRHITEVVSVNAPSKVSLVVPTFQQIMATTNVVTPVVTNKPQFKSNHNAFKSKHNAFKIKHNAKTNISKTVF